MAERFVGSLGHQHQTVLSAINASSSGDIITVTDGRTYTERLDDIQLNDITIRSSRTNPNNFPVLRLFFNSNTLNHINNWVFGAVIMEPNSNSRFTFNLKNITFRRCVFRNYDYLCACDCQAGRVKRFESCVFHDFSDYVFNAQQNYSDQALVVRNCTFHNCVRIFRNDFHNGENAATPQITNSVFTASPNIAPDVQDGAQQPSNKRYWLMRQFRHCTFTNDPQTTNSQLGAECLVNINENVIYAQSGAKAQPGDFKISNNPAVRNSGSDALGYSPDLGGLSRTSPYDRGAWEFDGEPPPPVKKKILPYINYQGAF